MKENETFNWCFIGCGTLAKVVAEQIIPSGRHRIVSVYTRREEAGEAFAKEYGGKAYASAKEAVNADGVDAVYVVTPHRSHAEYTRIALESGKPVLCEKAFTVNSKDAGEVIAFAKKNNVYLAEAMWTWFSPIARQVKKWLDDGEFGDITECIADMRTDAMNYAKRVTDPEAAGGALLDVGVYSIYYIYKLFGKPESVSCRGVLSDGIDWEDEITLNYKGGKSYKALASVREKDNVTNLKMSGSRASIYLPELQYASHAEFTDETGKKKEITADGSYLNEFDIVSGEIRQGLKESGFVSFEDTLAVMDIMDECRKQIGLKYSFE